MLRSRVGVLMFFLAVCAPLTGCVRYRGIAESAVNFNLAVERAQNEMLLLNAVRAAKRRPMYITGISNVTGSVRMEVSAGLDIPLSDPVEKVSPRATYSESPLFTVPVLDTQEFIKGFLHSVPNEVLAYYWEQGWPRSLLMHLFVQRVRVRTESTVQGEGKRRLEVKVYTFDNYPDATDPKLCKYVTFSRFVDRYLDPVKSNPRFEVKTVTRTVGPPMAQSGSLQEVLSANRDGLEVVREGDHFLVRQQRSDLALVVDGLEDIADFALSLSNGDCAEEGARRAADVQVSYLEIPDKDQAASEDVRVEMQKPNLTSEPASPGERTEGRPTVSVDFFIRSPEAMLYYLGQLMRVEEAGKMPEICVQGKLQPIFNAVGSDAGCGQGILSVRYEGERYTIPREAGEYESCRPEEDAKRRFSPVACVAGRSTQSLTLVSQLISLQKSAKDLPGTGLIRTVGQ